MLNFLFVKILPSEIPLLMFIIRNIILIIFLGRNIIIIVDSMWEVSFKK